MHRSRIGVIHVDHPPATWGPGVDFWAGVQGVEPEVEDPAMPEYLGLGRVATLPFYAQRLGEGTAARMHLDVETDDVPAEVARLTGLGARAVAEHEGWTVLADPGELMFCVVAVQQPDAFEREAQTWS